MTPTQKEEEEEKITAKSKFNVATAADSDDVCVRECLT